MSSDRPVTSLPSEGSEREDQVLREASSRPKVRHYVPHIFDLVTPTHRAEDSAKLYIPRAYLQSEAVNASLLLGHGASFAASRQTLPSGEDFLTEKVDMGTWTIEKKTPAPRRPKYIVYKSARVSFQANGEPSTAQDRRALQSVLTEFHALLHPPLFAHPNIIDFLGLAWGSNPFDPLHKLPVLVVEYADRGTLADLLSQEKALSDRIKLDLCLGIARGLITLHINGIVHGDVKPENILIFSHPKDTFIAKLADFGYAIVEAVEASEVSIGGTRTWRAPESSAPLPQEILRKTDTYSFGLLTWSMAIDGGDPFSLMIPNSLSGEERWVKIDFLKDHDQVIELSKFDHWIFRSKVLTELYSRLPSMAANFRDGIAVIADPVRVEQVLKGLSEESPGLSADLSAKREQLSSSVCQLYRQKVFYKILEPLFLRTLSKDPNKRDLDSVIQLLENGHGIQRVMEALTLQPSKEEEKGSASLSTTSAYNITNQSAAKPIHQSSSVAQAWSELGFKHRRISWQQMRDLEPNVQSFAAKAFLHSDEGPNLFCLCAFYLNGYGLEADVEDSLGSLARAAAFGDPLAQAYLYRLFISCKVMPYSDIQAQQYLERQALNGSRMALKDLRTLDPNKAHHIRELLKYGCAGVGAPWYNDSEMLHGFTQPKLMEKDFPLDNLGIEAEIQEIQVNKRGDYILHAAAAIGCYRLVDQMLTGKHVRVDQLNAKGETALLCACRSGHPDIVKLLLDNDAKASLQASNGESPLHWLLSFDDKINIAALGEDLIRRGADVHAFTTERIAHSAFPGSIDVDFQAEGTPLMWAVHHDCPRIVQFLLSLGADPNWRYSESKLSPLDWAAFYHHAKCLETMVNHLEAVVETPKTTEGKKDFRFAVLYGPLVQQALRASDKFSMILRNGSKYLDKLHATLAFLQKKTTLINFRLGNRGETLLHLAASQAHDEAVEFILRNGWKTEEVNKSCGIGGRTPLLESVRWNRKTLFDLLYDHGADVHALAHNPYDDSRSDWSALHIFANEAHNEDLALVDELLKVGVPIDGVGLGVGNETPLNVAVRRNAFQLAKMLLSRGAELNALSIHSSLITSPFPLTGLGHIIALNARYSSDSLQFMLAHQPGTGKNLIEFVVEPERKLSALHLAALIPDGFKSASGELLAREDFDVDTNRTVVHELLEWFKTSDQLNLRCDIEGKTALHLAVERGNVGVVEELVKAGAGMDVGCDTGETATDMARRLFQEQPILSQLLTWLK